MPHDLNNTFNLPIPGSPRFESDVAKAISRIRDSLGAGSIPAFKTIELPDLTASRLTAIDANNELESTDLITWVSGTTNQIISTDDTDGTITLSTPQDLDEHTDWKAGTLTVWADDEEVLMYVDSSQFYVTLNEDEVPIATGMPIGLLLTLTYNLD